jgi:hypothetical protein
VIDDRGQAVPSAEVELRPGVRRVIAAMDGQFVLFAVPFGEVELRVRRLGYSPVTVRFVTTAADTTITVTLPVIAQLLDSVRIRERASGLRFNLQVVDDQGGPVSGAEVLAAGLSRLTTDHLGQVVVTSPKRNTLMLRVRKIGYKPYFGSFTIAAERADTIVMQRHAQELGEVAIRELSGWGRDSFAFIELDSRLKWKTSRAAIISREDLAPFGDQNICSILQQTMSGRLAGRQVMAGCDNPTACTILNGERAVRGPISRFLASEIESIEFYPAGADWSGTVFSRGGLICYPYVRGSQGPGKHPGGYVIWLRNR